MKRTTLSTAMMIMACSAFAQKDYTLSGTTDADNESKKVYLYLVGIDKMIDSTEVVDHKYCFKGKVNSDVSQFVAIVDEKMASVGMSILEPGNIVQTGVNNWYGSGTPDNDAFLKHQRHLDKLLAEDPPLPGEPRSDHLDSLTCAYAIPVIEANINNGIGSRLFVNIHTAMTKPQLRALYDKSPMHIQNINELKHFREMFRLTEATEEGMMFKDFTAQLVGEGKDVKFSDYVGKGKYVLIDFWASWCIPCLRETQNIINTYEEFAGKDFTAIGIIIQNDTMPDAQKKIDQFKIPYMQLFDYKNEANEAYGTYTIPQIILFGPDGTILHRNLRYENIKKAVAKYVKPTKKNKK